MENTEDVENASAVHTGHYYEQEALEWLKAQGYKAVQQNFRARFAEIDLIMVSPESELVFIEIRARGEGLVGALESVDLQKQNRLRNVAHIFLERNAGRKILSAQNITGIRFDVLTFEPELGWVHTSDAF